MRRLLAALLVAAPLAGLVLAGLPAIGRALLSLGAPAAAAPFFSDPAWKGLALYSAGRWSEAAAAFGPAPAAAYNRGAALARAGRYAEAVDAFDAALAFDPDDDDARINRELVAALIDAGATKNAKAGGAANGDATRQLAGSRSPSRDSNATSGGSGLAGGHESSGADMAQGAGAVARSGAGGADAAQKGSGKATGSSGNASGEGRAGGVLAQVSRLAGLGERANRRLEFHAVLATREWLATMPDDPGAYMKLQILAERARRKTAPEPAPGGDSE